MEGCWSHRFSVGARRAALAAAALAACVSVGAAAPAYAGSADSTGGELLVDVLGDGAGFGHTTEEPWLTVDRLVPGSVEQRDLVLWNTTSQSASVHLQAVNVVDHENDCIRPERQVPTEGCETDGGELSSWLALEMAESGADAAGAPATEAFTLAELADSPAELPSTIGPGEKLPVTLRMTFLPGSGNDTMTDSVEFDTRITASHEGIDPQVLGIEATRGAGALVVGGPTVFGGPLDGSTVAGRPGQGGRASGHGGHAAPVGDPAGSVGDRSRGWPGGRRQASPPNRTHAARGLRLLELRGASAGLVGGRAHDVPAAAVGVRHRLQLGGDAELGEDAADLAAHCRQRDV